MTLFTKFKEKFIGTRAFYKMLLSIIVPLVISQGITNFVSLLDNVMVGQLGDLPMSAVSIINQLVFIFNLAIFGGLSGVSIFSTQYYGSGNWQGMRNCFRFKLYFAVGTSAVAAAILLIFGEPLVMLFLKSESNSAADVAATLGYALDYMRIAVIGLLPFALVQAYGNTLCEMGQTKLPMYAGLAAIGVNLCFNYLLIYGKFGFPALGVRGAAIATVMSRFVELFFIVIATHLKSDKYLFAKGIFSSFKVPLALVRRIVVTGTPLMVNEVMWSMGKTFINRSYSLRGIDVIAATNITDTAWNLFCIVMFAFGTAISIIIGQKLGEEDRKGAISTVPKLMFAAEAIHIVVAAIIILCSGLIPQLYNSNDYVKELARDFLIVCGIILPFETLVHNTYFVIRSGGKTFITFLFDSAYEWVIQCTLSYVLCKFTDMNIVLVFFIVMASAFLKLTFGIPMLKSGFWANTLIGFREHKNK